MTQTSLQIQSLSKSFPSGEKILQVLKDVSLEVPKGRKLAIVGRSGSGKSTLLHIIGTLDKATDGQMSYAGKYIHDLKTDEISEWRNANIGFVFQFHRLLPDFTALENVMMPALIAGQPVEEVKSRAYELLEQVGVAGRADHKPGNLSGGEQQRTAVARALIMRPSYLLADEPTGNLDMESSQTVLSLLLDANSKGATLIMVTHNMEIAKHMDECYKLLDGKLNKL